MYTIEQNCYLYFYLKKAISWKEANDFCLKRNTTLYSSIARDQWRLFIDILGVRSLIPGQKFPIGIILLVDFCIFFYVFNYRIIE